MLNETTLNEMVENEVATIESLFGSFQAEVEAMAEREASNAERLAELERQIAELENE